MTTVINDDACIRGLGGGSAIGTGDGIRRIVQYTTDATLKLSDAGCIIECISNEPITITIPAYADVAFDTGAGFDIVQIGLGKVTIAPDAGVTIESNGLVMNSQYSKAYLYHRDMVNGFVFSISPSASSSQSNTLYSNILTISPVAVGTPVSVALTGSFTPYDKQSVVIFLVAVKTATTIPYTVDMYTQGTDGTIEIYQTAILTGNYTDAIPFTIDRNMLADDLYLRVTNTGSGTISDMTVRLLSTGA